MHTRTTKFQPSDRNVQPLRDELHTLESPLTADEAVKQPILVRLIPLAIMVLVIVMLIMMVSMGRRMMSPYMLMMPAMMLMGMMGMTMHGGGTGGNSMSEVDVDRKNWLIQLRELRNLVQNQGRRIHNLAVVNFPNPQTLTAIDTWRDMWQVRRAQAYDEAMAGSKLTEHPFLSARGGVGMVPMEPRVQYEPQQVPENLEPVTAGAFARFLRTQQVVTNIPIGLRLDQEPIYAIRGEHIPTRLDLARGLVMSLAYNHSPAEVLIGVITDPENTKVRREWEWMKWLPHNQNYINSNPDMPPTRLAWSSLEDYAQDMAQDIAARQSQGSEYPGQRMVVFIDNPSENLKWPVNMLQGVPGVHFVAVRYADPLTILKYEEDRTNMFHVTPQGVLSIPGRRNLLTIDRVSRLKAENFARSQSRWRPVGMTNMAVTSPSETVVGRNDTIPSWFDVLNIHDLDSYDPTKTWAANAYTETFKVPIGYKVAGPTLLRTPELTHLDMVEASRGGTGPHGCVQGKTGTGKSYLLNGIVLTMCAMFGPDKVSFILADFKAGAAFDGFESLPHVIQVLTNLEEQKELIDRAGDVIDGEITRREEILFKYKVKDILDYRKLQKTDPSMPPLPDLFVIADEFHEFMNKNRPYLKLFTTIGAKGRSLGMHVVPCSQFIDAGLLGDFMNHLTFGISLTAATTGHSRTVIGDPSAASLPSGKGHAMIRYVDKETQDNKVDTFIGFPIEDPYVSKIRTEEDKVTARRELEESALPFGLFATDVEKKSPKKNTEEDKNVMTKVHDKLQKWALIEHLSKFNDVTAPALWQPSLTIPMSLTDIQLPELVAMASAEGLHFRLGDLDDPRHHSRPPFIISPKGNVGIFGQTKSGKSTAVKTMITSSAIVYRNKINWYVVDYAGGGLSDVEGFPNVGGYATKSDVDTIERYVGEFYNVLDRRERIMSERRLNITEYLAMKEETPDPADPYGYMFLVLDGFDAMVLENEEWKTSILRLLLNGKNCGLHVVVTAPDLMSLPMKQQSQFGTVVALRVEDTSRMGPLDMPTKQKMRDVPEQPGRGIDVVSKLPFLVMVPSFNKIEPKIKGERGRQDVWNYTANYSEDIRAVGRYLSEKIPASPAIAVAAHKIPYADVWSAFSSVPGITDRNLWSKKDRWLPLGVDTRTLEPVLMPKVSPHFLVAGDPQCGKTSTLRAIITSITNQYGPDEAKFVIFDPNFGLMDEMDQLVQMGYMQKKNYATTRDQTAAPVEMLMKILQKRLPNMEDLDPRALKDRSWFDGPEVFVIVDGYNRIGSSSGVMSPIDQLAPGLGAATDLGVHMIMSTSGTGLANNLGMNKILKIYNEQASPILLLSGPSAEPRLTSLRAKFEVRRPGFGQLLLPAESRSRMVQVAYTDPWTRPEQ